MVFNIKSTPENETYTKAINPTYDGSYIFWFDDDGRERATKSDDLEVKSDGTWVFTSERGEKVEFKPQKK